MQMDSEQQRRIPIQVSFVSALFCAAFSFSFLFFSIKQIENRKNQVKQSKSSICLQLFYSGQSIDEMI